MPVHAKSRRATPRRRTPVAASRSRLRPIHRSTKHDSKKAHLVERPVNPAAGSGYKSALKFLETLTDFERLRIVRYNTSNFDLDRMRTLLKKLGNPHEDFKSVHIAGT